MSSRLVSAPHHEPGASAVDICERAVAASSTLSALGGISSPCGGAMAADAGAAQSSTTRRESRETRAIAPVIGHVAHAPQRAPASLDGRPTRAGSRKSYCLLLRP